MTLSSAPTALARRNAFRPALPQAAGQQLLGRLLALEPMITARAEEIATGRRIPMDIIGKLREAGLYRAYVPHAYGGLQLAPDQVLRAVAALARIDGSVGWTALLGTSAQLFVGLLPQDGYAELYRDGPDMVFSGSDLPIGKAEPVGDGYLVQGRWPFATGCLHAEWIGGIAQVLHPTVSAQGDAVAGTRMFVARADRWTIEDTWRVIGLEGTGSHHIVLPPTPIDAKFSFDVTGSPPSCRSEPAFQNPNRWLPLAHAACQLGMARGALDDVVSSLKGGHARREQRNTSQSEVGQGEIGRLTVSHRAAEALLDDVLGEQWSATLAGDAENPALLPDAEGAATWIAATCREIAASCFALIGAGAVKADSSLGRRWRDLQVAGQHIKVSPAHYATLGRQRLAV